MAKQVSNGQSLGCQLGVLTPSVTEAPSGRRGKGAETARGVVPQQLIDLIVLAAPLAFGALPLG